MQDYFSWTTHRNLLSIVSFVALFFLISWIEKLNCSSNKVNWYKDLNQKRSSGIRGFNFSDLLVCQSIQSYILPCSRSYLFGEQAKYFFLSLGKVEWYVYIRKGVGILLRMWSLGCLLQEFLKSLAVYHRLADKNKCNKWESILYPLEMCSCNAGGILNCWAVLFQINTFEFLS